MVEQFRPLGRRDIFGILLPGTVVVFAAVYALFGMLTSLQLSVKGLLDQQFLLAVVLLIAAYLVGSLLRLYAADDVDRKSSEYLVEVWRKEHRAQIESGCIDDVIALQLSVWMLSASLIAQSLLVAALTIVPRWGISVALPVQWTFQGFYLVLTLVLMLVSLWMRRQIMRRFRGMRFKEAENVYFAFYYICSMPHSDRAAKKDQAIPRALPM